MAIPRIASYQFTPSMLPEAAKVNWCLNSDKAVLLIHDMQQYFLNFYDQTQSPIPEVIQAIQKLKAHCQTLDIPIIYTAQPGNQPATERALLTDFWGPGLPDDDALTRIIPELKPHSSDIVMKKWRYSAFKKSDLLERMEQSGRDQIMIVGVYTHIGCQQTVMDAFMHDQKAFLIGDATADFSKEEHQHALQYIANRAGRVITTEQAIQQLLIAREVA